VRYVNAYDAQGKLIAHYAVSAYASAGGAGG
jgi:hypothetical protein